MIRLAAPAKLTVSLRITGVRDDGYHLIDAEMETLDLIDELQLTGGDGLEIVDAGTGLAVSPGPDNLMRCSAAPSAGSVCSVTLDSNLRASLRALSMEYWTFSVAAFSSAAIFESWRAEFARSLRSAWSDL